MFDKNKIEFFLFKSVSALLQRIGLRNTRRFAKAFGSFIYYFIPIRKSTVFANLSIAFPQKKKSEIKKLVKKNFKNITTTFFELMILPFLSNERLLAEIEFSDPVLLEKVIKSGEPVLFLTAHFGNWEILTPALAALFPAKYNILVKPQRNNYITEWLKETRRKNGIKIISTGVSVKELYKALKQNEIVMIAGDQRGHFDSPRFNFFNRSTALFPGAATLAEKIGCKVICLFAERNPEGKYFAYTEQLSFDNLSLKSEERIREITQRYISLVESRVKIHPEQYFWMHKLWKY